MSTRANKSGIGAQIEKKMEDNYDREEAAGTPTHVVNWINGVVGTANDPEFSPIDAYDWKGICSALRDGVILCKLINVLLASKGVKAVTFKKKASQAFIAMTNIENFNKGCISYGMKDESLFNSNDLWEMRKGPFYNVLNTLHCLGFVANSNSFIPGYTGEQTKYME